MSWLARLEAKNASTDIFTPADAAERNFQLPLSRYNYNAAVRGGLDSNVIMAPIQWIMRAFPEADPTVERKLGKDKPWEHQDEHDLEQLLRNPNPGYDGASMLQATAMSYTMDGNAYWIKRRNIFGRPVEFWYVPHWMMEPRWSPRSGSFIDYYDYSPFEGAPQQLAPEDVVHLRFGIDPRNTRKGWSQIKSLMREIFTDEQAAHFSATILKNMGIPGLVLSPKDKDALPTKEDVEEIKRYLESSHTGDRQGKPMVFGSPTDVSQFGFDPNRLMLGSLRDIAEERVCAALGLPAAVVGFGAGLQSTKVGATMREMRRLAWVQCVIPMQLAIGRQLTKQLVPDFEALAPRWRVRFDTTGVSAFQEEETEKATRIKTLVSAGVMMVSEGQELAGLEVDPSQNVYLRPGGIVAIQEGDAGLAPVAATPAPTPANGEPGDEGDPATPAAPTTEEIIEEAAKALAARGTTKSSPA